MRSILMAALAVVLLLAQDARAQSAMELIEPRVDRASYLALLERVALDDEHRLIVDMLYSDYAVALEELAEDITAREADAGKQRVDDALSGKTMVDRTRLRELRVSVLRAREPAWAPADELVNELLGSVGSFVSADVDFAAAARDLRRNIYLQPRRGRGQEERYAGDGIDVTQLFEEARGAQGEFSSLDPSHVRATLDRYAVAVDEHLSATADADRRGRQRLAIARIERDVELQQRIAEEALERWAPFYRINAQAMTEIAALAEQHLGADAARRWRTRFDQACFPRLFRPLKADREIKWILRYVPDDEIQAKARALYDAFGPQRDALCREAIEIMLRGRLELQVPIYPRMDPSRLDNEQAKRLYQDLLKNSGRRASLDADTCASLEALITKRQRKQMASDIAAAAYGRRR